MKFVLTRSELGASALGVKAQQAVSLHSEAEPSSIDR